jgi:hypothetical protein
VNKQELENRLIEFAATIIVASKFEKTMLESSCWTNNESGTSQL